MFRMVLYKVCAIRYLPFRVDGFFPKRCCYLTELGRGETKTERLVSFVLFFFCSSLIIRIYGMLL